MACASATTRAKEYRRNLDDIQVAGYLDQNEFKWLEVKQGKAVAYARLNLLVLAPDHFWAQLALKGVVITANATRNRIRDEAQRCRFSKRFYLIDRSGWFGSHYIWPHSPVPARISGRRTYDAREASHALLSSGGSRSAYRATLKRMVDGQALPTFMLCCALLGLLLAHLQRLVGNPAFELFGDSSIGKSSMLRLAASVMGRGTLAGRTWSTTVNALESTMAANHDGLLLLDETNVFNAGSQSKTALGLKEATFKLTAGNTKARLHAETVPDYRFVALSSTNRPLSSILSSLPEADVAAANVQLITIRADAGTGLGVFDTLPDGCQSGGDAADQLSQLTHEHYGWLAAAFVAQLELRLAHEAGSARLQRLIARASRKFRNRAGTEALDGAERRIADSFVLVAVAGSLAVRWGVLPLGAVEEAVATVYARREFKPVPPSELADARGILRSYCAQHQPKFFDLAKGLPDLTNVELDQCPGFIKRTGTSRWLLVRKARWDDVFGSRAKYLLQELKALDLLWVRDGWQSQEKVRASRPKDRVYRIRLNG